MGEDPIISHSISFNMLFKNLNFKTMYHKQEHILR